MVLYTGKVNCFGKTINMGGNIVSFDKEGKCEVTKEIAAILTEKYGLSTSNIPAVNKEVKKVEVDVKGEIELLNKEISALKKERDELKSLYEDATIKKGPESSEEKAEEKVDEIEEVAKEIKSKSKAQLLVLCSDLGFEESEYSKLNVEDLRSYILNKYK